MHFHSQKVLALARLASGRADLAARSRPWHMHAFHSSLRCRKQYLDADEKTFNEVALNERADDKIVLVDFYADWCGPCKMISPILEKLVAESSNGSGRSLDLVTINTDKEVELAQKYQIRSLPTVMAFKNGKPINHFIGALKEDDVSKFLRQL